MNVKKKNKLMNELPPGLSAPARRALDGVGCQALEQVARLSETEISQLHGIGPRAIDLLRNALQAKGLSFADKP
jgi:hypothetical protein